MTQIVRKLRKHGVTPILMTPPRWGKTAKNGVGENPNRLLTEFLSGCHTVAQQEHVPLVDHFQFWTDAESKGIYIGDWTTDQCHPNPQGHRKLVDEILPVMMEAMKH